MNRLIIGLILSALCLSCDSDNENNDSSLAGQTYLITSYIIDSDVDLNGDGVFSNDLILENFISEGVYLETFNDCLELGQLSFSEEGITCPFASLPMFIVEDNNVGETEQLAICALFLCDGYSEYSISGDVITFSFEGEVYKQGVFLDNAIIVTFSVNNELGAFEFLNSDGTILPYNGLLTVTYTLQ